MDEIMLKIDNVSKKYKLGQIGGTTLRDELQRKRAKRKGLEDPTKEIGHREYSSNEEFYALNGVSFEVKKGERVGIIGHNGAGKSTLLKLISRVTAPTNGTISMNGRVASMLEVGTGFHSELTGRENIYMNGAILGMTKKEIDAKIEDIIEFSECREFIDTPVKRYSSGMYVKLAFSVAAHLDSEILIMDEVLAVGDMAFQKKCIDKMNDVSRQEGRTILYVSHNMNTIRELCDRVIVLDYGQVVFDGDVENGIALYINRNNCFGKTEIDLNTVQHYGQECTMDIVLNHISIKNKTELVFYDNEILEMEVLIDAKKTYNNVAFRLMISNQSNDNIGTSWSAPFNVDKIGEQTISIFFPLNQIPNSNIYITLGIDEVLESGEFIAIDHIKRVLNITIKQRPNSNVLIWQTKYWGNVKLNDIIIKK